MTSTKPSGMKTFTLIWVGQVFSLFGSAMTQFALTIWAYQVTEKATVLALVGFFGFAPMVLISPIAGVLVDRWNRKLTMMISDIATGMATAILLVLYTTGNLQIWHLYVLSAFSGLFQAFQWPAYSAAISLLIPKTQYARASGMMSLAQYGAGILAPITAAALLKPIGINGIMIIDLLTLALAIVTLLIAAIPAMERVLAEGEKQPSIWRDSLFGFKFIFNRPGLFWLQMIFFMGNFMASLGGVLINPMILASTGQSATMLSVVQSAGAIGGVVGGLIIASWGGFKQKVEGVLLGWMAAGLMGFMFIGTAKGVGWIWVIGNLMFAAITPIINASNQAIWQSKVPPQMQGRVFSVRMMIATITAPLAMLAAGPLADKVFEPALRVTTSAWSHSFGGLVGTGPGTGMALILVFSGLLMVLVGAIGYIIPSVRNIEKILPDHDTIQNQ